jgi:hypothetical protein
MGCAVLLTTTREHSASSERPISCAGHRRGRIRNLLAQLDFSWHGLLRNLYGLHSNCHTFPPACSRRSGGQPASGRPLADRRGFVSRPWLSPLRRTAGSWTRSVDPGGHSPSEARSVSEAALQGLDERLVSHPSAHVAGDDARITGFSPSCVRQASGRKFRLARGFGQTTTIASLTVPAGLIGQAVRSPTSRTGSNGGSLEPLAASRSTEARNPTFTPERPAGERHDQRTLVAEGAATRGRNGMRR